MYQRIAIGNNVFIGVNLIVIPGMKIDDDVIIAARSAVTKSIIAGVIAAGVPAKIIGGFNNFKSRCLNNCDSESGIIFNKKF